MKIYYSEGISLQFIFNKVLGKTDYEKMADEEVVKAFNQGDRYALEYLMIKYKNFVKYKARSYYLIGGDREDVIQEGMIGLYKAVLDYDITSMCYFRSFADICIRRQIITAIKTATRQKHRPLNSYISLNKPIYENTSNRTLLDIIISNRIMDPEELIISKEDLDFIEDKIEDVLSGFELEVLSFYLEGIPYQEIAIIMNRSVKSIDNALQRIKRKLEGFLREDEKLALDNFKRE